MTSYSTDPVAYDAPSPARASVDPLRYCVMTTVALLAWLLSPPFVVAAMGAIGFWFYWQAMRGGLSRTRCVLRHPRLVLAYLGLAVVAGVFGVVGII